MTIHVLSLSLVQKEIAALPCQLVVLEVFNAFRGTFPIPVGATTIFEKCRK